MALPNWCYTTYYFDGNQKDIHNFYKQLNDLTSKPGMENGFGNNWLGNILYHAGLEKYIDCENPKEEIRCRGVLSDISEDYVDGDSFFTIETETAWRAMPVMFQKVIEYLGYDIRFAYQSEEPNAQYYEIYDKHGLGCFAGEDVYVDIFLTDPGLAFDCHPFLNDIYDYRYWCKDEFESWLSENGLNSKEELEKIDLPFEDDYIIVHYFEHVNELYD